MTTRILTSFVAVVALVALAGVRGKATSAESANSLTFNRSVALPGVTLPAGTYLFERLEGWANVVRVTEAKTRRPLYMGFTDPVRRPQTLQVDQLVVLGEAPRGEPTRVAIWFPIGRRDGHRFIY